MRTTTITGFIIACVAAACVRTATNPASGTVDVDVESPTKQGEDWKGTLRGQDMYTNVGGETTALVYEGETQSTVNITGATPGATHPWHIHEGDCGSGGPIVGNPSAYPPLVVGNDGTASASARITVQLNEAKHYFVNVHASPTNLATIVACGSISD
jgi:superoxide dismutase, Cu-Zn family